MNQTQEMQRIMRHYKTEKNVTELDLHEVAKFANEKLGWKLPKPKDPLDALAKKFALAARQETRIDQKTGRPYRANHALSVKHGNNQMTLWIDIDDATRKQMHKSCITRREQMVGDGLQLSLDIDHWNDANQTEEPLNMPMDFTDDIEWRKNIPDKDVA